MSNANAKPLREWVSFLIVGGVQAVANYATYLLVLQVATWQVAFLAALAVGIAIQSVLQIRTTFGEKFTWRAGRRYAAYQLGYAVVFWMLLSLVIGLGVLEELAPLVVMCVTTPANFLLSRKIIRHSTLS